mmetsp:Transcript_126995/g.284038  ORF Transcript_126995/g.284038 Transcript_126995/m.284038 type:complete len:940 (-) Transcript_126995:62-2881(-)
MISEAAFREPTVGGLRIGSLVQVNGLLGQLTAYVKEDNRFKIVLISGETVEANPADVQVPKDLGKPGTGGDEASFDVLLGPQTADNCLAQEMATCIFEKGFCVLKLCQKADDVQSTVEAVRQQGDLGKLGRLPAEVEEGYLGNCGMGKVIWLDPDDQDLIKDDVLEANDRNLSYLASLLQPFSEDALGKIIDERTPALVSLSLQEDEEDDYPQPMADDKILGDYLGTWRRGLLRAVHFMGPGEATVALESRGGATGAALPHLQELINFKASPNTIILYRTEVYNYSCTSEDEILTMMASYLAQAPQFKLLSWDGDMNVLDTMNGGPPPPQGECVNVLNTSTRLGANWDEGDAQFAGMFAALDTVSEIPITRFDVDFYYCADPDEINFGPPRTVQRHTSLVEGSNLFDNKYFEINANEAVAMDPLQRHVLEVGGACLMQHGVTKKISNRVSHHAGCSVGLDKADFASLNIETGGSSAGNNALAICANRFSFTFNLKGPNFICDTACSASLTATHLAKLAIRERTWDPLQFWVAIGTHLCLSIGPWIGTSMSHMVSPQGRCFSFAEPANGYLRGEGTSGQLLQWGSEPEGGRDAVFRSSACGQDGRSATLTAPNGPAQESLIKTAIAEAEMSPIESTSWECHGTGTSLGDPIEVGAVRKVMIKYNRENPLMMTTSKSNIGHLEGGAGMAAMVKCVQMVKHCHCLPTLHLGQLNPHLEHNVFDSVFETEGNGFPFKQGHAQVSSFGFGGSNGHVIYWGRSQTDKMDVKDLIMKRLRKMAPPEVRPIGDDPSEWESDLPDDVNKPGDIYHLIINDQDPVDAPIKWVKTEAADEDEDDESFYDITGNFNGWESDRMSPGEAIGQFQTTATVPSNGMLEFRFLRDGDSEEVLAPEVANCTRKTAPIIGPKSGLTTSWVIKADPDTEFQIELCVIKGRRGVLWFKI